MSTSDVDAAARCVTEPVTLLDVPEALSELASDADATRRAIGCAIVRCVLDDLPADERAWVQIIEELRARLNASPDEVSVRLLSRRSSDQVMKVGDVARTRSKKLPWVHLLMALVRELRPARVLELGSAVGLSAAYLTAGLRLNGGGELVTVDGAPGLAELTRQNLGQLGFHEPEVVTGMFKDVLPSLLERMAPIDLVFVDGHHDEVATQAYFDDLIPALSSRAVVVFDDIAWSPGMERAWQRVRHHPAVRTSIGLEKIGICVLGPPQEQAQLVDLPGIPAMRRQAVSVEHPPVSGDVRVVWGERPRRTVAGWVCVGPTPLGGADHVIGDAVGSLPFGSGTVDVVACPLSLPTLSLEAVVPALEDFRRILRPGGILRLCLPDLERLTELWLTGQVEQFVVPDHQSLSPSGKFIVHALWYGRNRSLFTYDFARELLLAAGFTDVRRSAFGETAWHDPAITQLDDLSSHCFFVEATA